MREIKLVRRLAPVVLAAGFTVFGAAAVTAQGADDPAQLDAGQEVYTNSCAGCHGADGEGTENGRPLTDIASQQPDRAVHVAAVTDGKGGMPPFAAALTTEEIDASVTYVRLTFQTAAGDDELPLTGPNDALPFFGAGLLALGLLLSRLSRWNPRAVQA